MVIEATKKLTLKAETNKPETYALVAYMLLRTSRLRAIINNVARVPDLKNQNRMLWNRDMIEDGLQYLNKSAGGREVTEYHLRAGICACHALAKDYESTDWEKIISLYDQYLEIHNVLDIALERVEIILDIQGPVAAVRALSKLDPEDDSEKSKIVSSRLADLYIRLSKYDEAVGHLLKSHKLTEDKKERSLLLNRIEFCKQQLELSSKYDKVLSF